jgi:hypothetical protein
MRIKSKVVSVSATATAAQIESALDNQLNNGWEFVGIFQVGVNFFAIMVKRLTL